MNHAKACNHVRRAMFWLEAAKISRDRGNRKKMRGEAVAYRLHIARASGHTKLVARLDDLWLSLP